MLHMNSSAEASAGAPENVELGYALWAVLRRDPAHPATVSGDLSAAVTAVEGAGVTIRGWYDVSSIRADADLMVWLHGPDPQKLQWALRELRSG
jgi:chlorite dismutase